MKHGEIKQVSYCKKNKCQISEVTCCYVNQKSRQYSREDAKTNYGRERAVSYSQRIRSNERCVYIVGRKLCCLSGNVVIL